MPLLGMFARRDISPGDELTFSYGEKVADATTAYEYIPVRARRPCYCGTKQCVGFLPAAPV